MAFSVMIVDSKAATRSRIACFLRKMPDVQIVAQAACPREAAEKFQLTRPPDLVVMGPGLQATAQMDVVKTTRRVARVKLCLMRAQPESGPRNWEDGIALDLAADAVVGLPDDGCALGGLDEYGQNLADRLRGLVAAGQARALRNRLTDIY